MLPTRRGTLKLLVHVFSKWSARHRSLPFFSYLINHVKFTLPGNVARIHSSFSCYFGRARRGVGTDRMLTMNGRNARPLVGNRIRHAHRTLRCFPTWHALCRLRGKFIRGFVVGGGTLHPAPLLHLAPLLWLTGGRRAGCSFLRRLRTRFVFQAAFAAALELRVPCYSLTHRSHRIAASTFLYRPRLRLAPRFLRQQKKAKAD